MQQATQRHGGKVVKLLGDGVMCHFAEPADAVRGALEVTEAVASDRSMPPTHVGISAGPVVSREGDYFGRAVVLATRISSVAGPGEIVVTADVVATVDDPSAFKSLGVTELKGIADPLELFVALPR